MYIEREKVAEWQSVSFRYRRETHIRLDAMDALTGRISLAMFIEP